VEGEALDPPELDLLNELRERAEEEAIRVFAKNLRDLLLAAPAGPRATMGLDPGIRTGVKVAVVDAPARCSTPPPSTPTSRATTGGLAEATIGRAGSPHGVELIAIGNGTASRETDKLAAELIEALGPSGAKVTKVVVSEAGASVYSASELASRASSPTSTSACAARCPSPAACRTRSPSW
jgi:uncharacterized protein